MKPKLRSSFTLGLVLAAALAASHARALEVVTVAPDASTIDLSGSIERYQSESNGRVTITTAPGADGKTSQIVVRSSAGGTHWAAVALANKGDKPLERLLVAAPPQPSGLGLLFPTRTERRILSVTASAGAPVQRVATAGNVFALTLDPGSVVTYVIELGSAELPDLALWTLDAFQRHQSETTAHRDYLTVVIGVALAILIVIVLRGLRRARRSRT